MKKNFNYFCMRFIKGSTLLLHQQLSESISDDSLA